MRAIKSIILFLLLCLLSFSCSDNPTATNFFSAYEWETSNPEQQGINSTQLNSAFQEAEKRTHIYSIVVIKNGYLIGEKYFNSYNKNSAFNIRSVSKSFLSAMAGIALKEKFIKSIDEKMLDFYPEYATGDLDQRKYNITIEHLLTMQGGIENEHNNYMTILNSANWIKETIEYPLLYNPGERFSYNTFHTHILSGIITKTTGMSTLEFGQKYLCEPLEINIHEWEQGPQGIYFGGNNMYFTTRDIAKLGYLYLNNGMLNNRQIVPEDWVTASLANQLSGSIGDWGELKNIGYGYLWWLGEIKEYEVFVALGFGGQFIISFPELNMIVAVNSDPYINSWELADENERSVLDVVANYILPSVM